MNKITTTLYALPLLLLASCDSKEDAFWVGPEPTDVISADVAEIHLNADGEIQNVNITSIGTWDAELTENQNVFNFTPSSGKGNGTISVSASPNYTGDVKNSTLLVTARDFGKQVSVKILQSSLTFEMEAKDYPVTSALGGEVDLNFRSTTGWEFNVLSNSADPNDIGDIEWLEFVPGTKGNGSFYDIQAVAKWKPNHTLSEREITLVLVPTKQNILEYLTTEVPQPFTLRQQAGSLPSISNGDTESVSKTEIIYKFDYESETDVIECGVKVLEENDKELMTVLANKEGETYANKATGVRVNITGLTQSTTYKIIPFVTNLVGQTTGEEQTVRTMNDETTGVIPDESDNKKPDVQNKPRSSQENSAK